MSINMDDAGYWNSPEQCEVADMIKNLRSQVKVLTQFENPVQLLADLVEALDSTYWSSWQNTYTFQNQLDRAREYIEKQEGDHA